jgi:hypothetical protein
LGDGLPINLVMGDGSTCWRDDRKYHWTDAANDYILQFHF